MFSVDVCTRLAEILVLINFIAFFKRDVFSEKAASRLSATVTRAVNELKPKKEKRRCRGGDTMESGINLQRSLLSVVDVVLFDIHPISFSIKNH